MIKEEEIVLIIQKKLEGSISSDEMNILDQWLEVSANAESYAQYQQLWAATSSIADKKEPFITNTSKSWEAIEQQIVVDKPKRRFKVSYAIAASVALFVMLFGANYLFNSNSQAIQYVLQANEKDTLTFSDGSQAYLFGPCSITYSEKFSSNERLISMEGFAYFDIAHDKERPFVINTEKGKVEVLGTSFTVDTRQNEAFSVHCITGKVRVTGTEKGDECETILTKNRMATYTSQSKQLAVASFEAKDLSIKIPVRNMTFNNKPLGEILERIEYNYDVKIQLENEDLLKTKYSTSLNDTTIDDFFNELKVTFKVDVIQTETATYILKGGSLN